MKNWPQEIEEGLFLKEERRRPPWVTNLVLFVLTVFTTLLAGAFQAGVNPIKEPLSIIKGVPFSFSLLIILLSHELAHYYFSRRHRVLATLPYFIPAPPIIGTFGAVIKTRSPLRDRASLLDIGVAGPIAGMILALPICGLGLYLSDVMPTEPEAFPIRLGSCVAFSILVKFVVGSLPEGYDLVLHPVAFAGWLGFWVTSLNLMPLGMLDGGHIWYALFGKKVHLWVSRMVLGFLLLLGILGWPGYLIWALLVFFLGIGHPPPLEPSLALDRKRQWLGGVGIFLFCLTFTPVPFDW